MAAIAQFQHLHPEIPFLRAGVSLSPDHAGCCLPWRAPRESCTWSWSWSQSHLAGLRDPQLPPETARPRRVPPRAAAGLRRGGTGWVWLCPTSPSRDGNEDPPGSIPAPWPWPSLLPVLSMSLWRWASTGGCPGDKFTPWPGNGRFQGSVVSSVNPLGLLFLYHICLWHRHPASSKPGWKVAGFGLDSGWRCCLGLANHEQSQSECPWLQRFDILLQKFTFWTKFRTWSSHSWTENSPGYSASKGTILLLSSRSCTA